MGSVCGQASVWQAPHVVWSYSDLGLGFLSILKSFVTLSKALNLSEPVSTSVEPADELCGQDFSGGTHVQMTCV